MSNALSQFVWTTQDGDQISPRDMRTSHLFYALRMVYNHSVPAVFSIEGHRYAGVRQWPKSYRKQAVAAFVSELARRKPLPAWMEAQLLKMKEAANQLERKQLV